MSATKNDRRGGVAPRLRLGSLIVALIAVLIIQFVWMQARVIDQIPYSEFQARLDEGRIARVEATAEMLRGTYTEPVDGRERFVTRRVDEPLRERLEAQGVVYDGVVEDSFLRNLLSWLIPIAIVFGLWWVAFRRFAARQGLGGGLMQIGKSKARVLVEEETGASFRDVAGIDESREELQEIVAFLKDTAGYGRLGARPPKGVLLAGPPGTGKTLIARAVAGEAAVPFFSISGSEFVEMIAGVGAARTRDLFRQARERAPAIIFIDELDALGRARSAGFGGMGGGNDEKEQTLNQLLVEMDGFDPSDGLVVIGATNLPESLDPALLRAGRFDRRVLIDRPEKRGRAAILDVHMARIVRNEDTDSMRIAELTPGFTGADLENLVNEAALLATRRDAESVAMQDFTAAIERIVAGQQKKNRVLSEPERRRVAYHELGHALAALTLPGQDPVRKVSIIPRSIGALGYSMQRPTEERYLMTRDELQGRMAVLLAGRAAEQVVFDEISTGAADDLRHVTDIARAIVAEYGMIEALGQLVYGGRQPSVGGMPTPGRERRHADDTAREIDRTARAIVDTAYEQALSVVRANRDGMDAAAGQLLESETMDEAELREAFGISQRKAA